MATFGLTADGFVPKQQSDIIQEMKEQLQAAFGQNLNFAAESVFGQIIGIFSERETMIWQLAEAVYQSQYPSGATGTSVDNILALNNLQRLAAEPTVTAPTVNGLYGLVCFGTPGTVIPAASIVFVEDTPTTQFLTDEDITIADAVDAEQKILFSAVPDVGSFKLSIIDPEGVTRGPTVSILYTANAAAVQAAIRSLTGYDDVVVTGSFAAGFTVAFDGDSGESVQNNFFVPTGQNSLMDGVDVVNIAVTTTVPGSRSQGTGSATCTVDGPVFVAAGSLTGIGSPTSGWDSVTNELDCITGSDEESDTDAMIRRKELLQSNANGPIQSIVDKVALVDGVTSVSGQVNTGLASQQQISFSGVPVSGHFQYQVGANTTVQIQWDDGSAELQNAIRAFAGYESVVVTGNYEVGFTVAFNGADGGQPLPLGSLPVNTLGVGITGSVSFGLPGKSFEIIVQGGSDEDIATAIFKTQPGGIESYGRPVETTGDVDDGSSTIQNVADLDNLTEGMRIQGEGVAVGSRIQSIAGNDITMTLPAIGTVVASDLQFINGDIVKDARGNEYFINFSRPIIVDIFVRIVLETDLTVSPSPAFEPGSIPTIQADIVAIGAEVPIGGYIIGRGSDGLIGAFNSVPGILNYTLYFGYSNPPTDDERIQLPPGVLANFETFNVVVSYT